MCGKQNIEVLINIDSIEIHKQFFFLHSFSLDISLLKMSQAKSNLQIINFVNEGKDSDRTINAMSQTTWQKHISKLDDQTLELIEIVKNGCSDRLMKASLAFATKRNVTRIHSLVTAM